ncbi:hypothetical protein C882_2634 [Caenispirillum salinarum AK4]|uniref:Uncharacterized protein n=1 Tax=Caenispirillum salinarum AK4 TaxID=1238182 RepID=K9H2S4_9PROT|nr:hypothetical protein C882_2634 [Caenispirillum salinarum AK4]
MIDFLSRLYRRTRGHRKTEDLPKWIRKRMYRELLAVRDQEHEMAELLDLPVPPRLSVVDEERIAMLRPRDRDLLGLDEMMRRAREEKREEETQQREERSRRRHEAREGEG